jgi:hypothetical protein
MRKFVFPRSFFAIAAALLPGGVTGASLADPVSVVGELVSSTAPSSGETRVSAPDDESSRGVSPPSLETAESSLPLQEIRAKANKERSARRIEGTHRADSVPL